MKKVFIGIDFSKRKFDATVIRLKESQKVPLECTRHSLMM